MDAEARAQAEGPSLWQWPHEMPHRAIEGEEPHLGCARVAVVPTLEPLAHVGPVRSAESPGGCAEAVAAHCWKPRLCTVASLALLGSSAGEPAVSTSRDFCPWVLL